MPDEQDKSASAYSGANVPPPSTAEVSVRTMQSDIARMGESGGTVMPAGETISVAVGGARLQEAPIASRAPATPPADALPPSMREAEQPTPAPGAAVSAGPAITPGAPSVASAPVSALPSTAKTPKQKMSTRTFTIVVAGGVVGAIVLFAVGFYLFPLLLGGKEEAATPPIVETPSGETQQTPPPVETPPARQSLFALAPEATLILRFSEGILGANIASLVSGSGGAAKFLEIEIHDSEGAVMPWENVLSTSGVGIDATFFSNNFDANYAAYALNDGGVTTGYVFRLKDGKLPLVVSQQAPFALERSPQTLAALYAVNPGAPQSSFQDTLIDGQPVRSLTFENGKLLYGFFKNKFLIIGTSEAALREAIRRL